MEFVTIINQPQTQIGFQ